MSAAKTAKFLNGLLQTQKADRTRIKELEARLAEVDIRQAATVTAAVKTAETRFQTQLDQVQQGHAAERAALTERHAAELAALTELVTNKDWQITELTQQVRTTRQLLAAADSANLELQGTIEALGENLDRATRAAADLADDRAEITKQREEITKQREALKHLLDEVREHMRKKDLERESAILNRQALSRAVPGINRK